MKQTRSMIHAMVTLLLIGVVFCGCADDLGLPEYNEGTLGARTYTMTVQASMCNDGTRALSLGSSTINATWAEGEEVTVYNVTKNADLEGTLVAKSSGTSTTLKGQLTGTIANGDQLKLKFLSPTYSSQNGTLTGSANSIDKVCDYAEALVTVSSVTNGYVITSNASFTNQQAIVKFTLLDKGNGDAAISPSSLFVSDGTHSVCLTNIPSNTYTTNGNGVLYVAFPASGTKKTISLNVIGGSKHYFYEKSGVTFTNSKVYDITAKLGSTGALPGKFTINAGGGQVSFSQGNLQYQASSGTWRFAPNQYDMIGSDNANISNSYTGWIDLFGWGTGDAPTKATQNNSDYSTCTDWGVNAIFNGGNAADLWRTLSKDEWVYLFGHHTKGWSTVNGVNGYVIRPDGISTAVAASYTASEWVTEEAAGSVFLPAAGSRGGTSVGGVGAWGDYWSSTPYNSNNAYYLYFNSSQPYPSNNTGRFGGRSVRMVYETPFQGAGTQSNPYIISSEADWIILANKVNSGNSFTGKFFRQTANIDVSTMVGISTSKPFSGTYDGYGKTLNLNLSTSESHAAPFRFIENATIKNVVTTGTVYSTVNHPSGLVGITHGTCTIQNCRVGANVGGAQHSGGIVGHCHTAASISIIGCVYSGTLSPASGQYTGGIIGWGGDGGGHTMTISNCLFAGSVVGSTSFHPVGIVQNTDNNRIVSNTYYTVAHNLSNENTHGNSFVKDLSYKGKFARSITAGTGVTVARAGAATEYNVSGITSYGTGILYNGVLYAGDGEEVSLTLSHTAAPTGSTFDQYTVSGGGTLTNPTTNSPTLTMTDANQTINVQWNITYTAPTLRTSLTFNGHKMNVSGSAQNLVNAGSVSHGTIYYSTNGGSSWSTSVPQATNAGTYTVHYKVVPDAGYSGGVGSTSLGSTTIAKVNGWCELSSYSSNQWNKSGDKSVTITVNHHGGTLTCSTSGSMNNISVSISGNKVTISKTGTHTGYGSVTITSAATTNYNADSVIYRCNT